MKDLGGDTRVIEVDILNGDKWTMTEGPLYALLQMAIDGQLGTILGSPNCRTRSKLRHVPVPGLPSPVREWGEANGGRMNAKTGKQRSVTKMI